MMTTDLLQSIAIWALIAWMTWITWLVRRAVQYVSNLTQEDQNDDR